MYRYEIADWDDAYANMPHIVGGAQWPERWAADAAAFRDKHVGELDIAYGTGARETLDLFKPDDAPKGLVVFVHGGFWMKFDKSYWSHFAAGPLAHGWAVAMPSYPLCPDVGIGDIAVSIGRAVIHAATLIDGPIHLAGHSAGGHLVTSMIAHDTPLSPDLGNRIKRVVSISGVHDLRSLLPTELNQTFGLDMETATAVSPALKRPATVADLVTWVGAGERAEFLRQSQLLANVWLGLGMAVTEIEEPDRHHFDVLDGMLDADGALTRAIVGA